MAEAAIYIPDPREPTTYGELPGGDLGSGGSGGGVAQQVYEGRDPLPPDDPTLEAINFPTGGGPTTQWSVGLQVWV